MSAPAPQFLPPEIVNAILDRDKKNIAAKVAAGKTLSASERNLLTSMLDGGEPSEATFAKRQEDLAKILGVDRRTINRWQKLPGNPGKRADGRYEVAAWRVWKSKQRGEGEEPELELQDEGSKTRLERLRAEKLEVQIAELRGELIDRAQAVQDVGTMIANARRVLLGLSTALASQVVGVSVAEAEQVISEGVHEALAQLHQDPFGERKVVTEEPEPESERSEEAE